MQVPWRRLPGVPSAHVIRLLTSGVVAVEGPVVTSDAPVPRAAQLLTALLPKRRGAEQTRLWQVIDRALKDPPAILTLDDFASELAPFAPLDPVSGIAALAKRCIEVGGLDEPDLLDDPEMTTDDGPRAPSEATVSDIRRARRDTGLPLEEVSKKSRIPVSMLRQLEWGYLRHWPKGLYGRTQLGRYARAAGLNRDFVLDALLPLIEADGETPVESGIEERTVPAAAAAADPIVIMQPTFAPGEVLFEGEGAAASVAPPIVAPDDPPVRTFEPARVAEPVDPYSTRASRRSMVLQAAAALIIVTAAGALWGLHDNSADRRRSMPSVRQVPALALPHDDSSAGDLDAGDRVRESRSRPMIDAAPAVSTGGVRARDAHLVVPVSDTGLLNGDEDDDDGASTSTSFASAGGVAFADPTQPAAGAIDAGLGLRVTRIVDEHSRNYHTRPSPDGTQVAFDSDRDGERGVFVADADGRNLRRVSGQGFAAVPNWAPDGRTLSFVRAELDNPNVWNLWALDLASGESRRLTSNTSGRPQGGSWFPDGQRIAYSRGGSIVVLDAASGRPTTYPTPQPGRAAGPPAISPDGRYAIFQVTGDGAWLLDLSDGASRKVLSDPSAGDFTWSPDGSRVAYYSRRDAEWNVWVTVAR